MDNISKVTKEDVQRVARESLNNDKFITVVLGNQKAFDKPLNTLGEVTHDVTIPSDNSGRDAVVHGASPPSGIFDDVDQIRRCEISAFEYWSLRISSTSPN